MKTRLLLLLVFLALLGRVLFFVAEFGESSLQMDFAAFYTAGQAMSHGLSPYVNHVDHTPPIWDGLDTYRHSRFLYPPPAARLFQALVLLPYPAAKLAWMLASLLALAVALVVGARIAGLEMTPRNLLLLGIVAAAFFPLLAQLERGQGDAFTLLCILVAVRWIAEGRRQVAAGGLLAVATLLKLHCIYLLPFVLLGRRWRVAGGFLAGGALMLGLTLPLDAGLWRDYLLEELPRISRYGEDGTRSMRLPPAAFHDLLRGVEPGRTVMQGREYDRSSFDFTLNATLVRTAAGRALWQAGRRHDLALGLSQLSLPFLALGLLLVVGWHRRWGPPAGDDPGSGELAYWTALLVLILLCAPATWAMNAIWMLPVAVVVLRELEAGRAARQGLALGACVAGLVFAGVPDGWLAWLAEPVLESKYIAAELLCLGGLLGLWRAGATRRPG